MWEGFNDFMGEVFAKLILFVAAIVVMRVALGSVDGYEADEEAHRAYREMFQLTAYIQHDLNAGGELDPALYPQKLRAELGDRAGPEAYEGIRCHEIPVADRQENLKDVTFYLFDEKTQLGVLANGSAFRGNFRLKNMPYALMHFF